MNFEKLNLKKILKLLGIKKFGETKSFTIEKNLNLSEALKEIWKKQGLKVYYVGLEGDAVALLTLVNNGFRTTLVVLLTLVNDEVLGQRQLSC